MIQRTVGSAFAAASCASTQVRIAGVPATPVQAPGVPVPSTPSRVSVVLPPQSIVTKNVLPHRNEYVRSFPGKFEKAQWTIVGVLAGSDSSTSWLPAPGSMNDPCAKICHLSYVPLTPDSSCE